MQYKVRDQARESYVTLHFLRCQGQDPFDGERSLSVICIL